MKTVVTIMEPLNKNLNHSTTFSIESFNDDSKSSIK